MSSSDNLVWSFRVFSSATVAVIGSCSCFGGNLIILVFASHVLSEATTLLVSLGGVGCSCAIVARLAALVKVVMVEPFGWSRSQ
ncbi:transmembrane protein, putative [Medicago truncatula]|uniref:Transmembrane protein, putative n=1 Tax=Medicago truncatula TaxID=3880 RepID=G7I3S4_MEDTR|nr:transmembrane protein, putative [Medicago truncatula]